MSAPNGDVNTRDSALDFSECLLSPAFFFVSKQAILFFASLFCTLFQIVTTLFFVCFPSLVSFHLLYFFSRTLGHAHSLSRGSSLRESKAARCCSGDCRVHARKSDAFSSRDDDALFDFLFFPGGEFFFLLFFFFSSRALFCGTEEGCDDDDFK